MLKKIYRINNNTKSKAFLYFVHENNLSNNVEQCC